MSVIRLEHADLVFRVWRERRIKDVLIAGSKKFSDFINHIH